MKRFTKLVSLVLALAMVFSIASCSAKRRTGAKRIQSDEFAKQEYGMETDYTEPTETDVTYPDPTETDPTPEPTTPPTTATTETDPTSTTPSSSSTGSGTEAYTAEYLYVAGILFIGGNQNTSKRFIEATFSTNIGEPVSTDKPQSTPSYTAYTYECNIVIDGVEFNRVEIDVSDSNGAVFQVSFINNKVDDNTLDEYQKMYADKLKNIVGKDLTDKSSGSVKSNIAVLDSGTTIDVGNVKDGKNNSFWVSFYNDNYLG